jgi:branched-subunit amino acid ABC-type transport system permease component
MLATGVLALALHLAVLHPLRGRGLVATSLITVGLGLMLRDIIFLAAGSELHAYRLDQSVVYDLGLIRISPGQAIAVALAVVVTPALTLLLARTPLGKSMRATADNRDLAAIAGIDVDRIGRQVWILAGALAGLGGVMTAVVQGVFDPNLGFQILFMIFTTVVLGGIGSAYGALAGGIALGLVMELSTWSGFAGGLDAKYKPVLAFLALIVLLLWRPQGLFGRARVL